jgi:hypothetical protein
MNAPAILSYSKEALMDLGRRHWREHLPRSYCELEGNGTLEQALDAAATMLLEQIESIQAAGVSLDEAWQMSSEILLKPEERESRATAAPAPEGTGTKTR